MIVLLGTYFGKFYFIPQLIEQNAYFAMDELFESRFECCKTFDEHSTSI